MGMTIDEHIVMLRSYKKLMWGTECDKRYGDTFNFAISTMRKYQKIQEIYERFQKDGNYYHHMAWLDVKKVVEDGNNNQHN